MCRQRLETGNLINYAWQIKLLTKIIWTGAGVFLKNTVSINCPVNARATFPKKTTLHIKEEYAYSLE